MPYFVLFNPNGTLLKIGLTEKQLEKQYNRLLGDRDRPLNCMSVNRFLNSVQRMTVPCKDEPCRTGTVLKEGILFYLRYVVISFLLIVVVLTISKLTGLEIKHVASTEAFRDSFRLTNLGVRTKHIIICISLFCFAVLHLTNIICPWYLYPLMLIMCLPQFILGTTATYFRIQLGFFAGLAFHCLINVGVLLISHGKDIMSLLG